jgi:hypothetical protein
MEANPSYKSAKLNQNQCSAERQTVKAKSFMYNCAKQEIAWLELHFAMCESYPSPPTHHKD